MKGPISSLGCPLRPDSEGGGVVRAQNQVCQQRKP